MVSSAKLGIRSRAMGQGQQSTKHRAIDGSRTPDDDPSLVEKIELTEAAN
jgi:hypothetical protein